MIELISQLNLVSYLIQFMLLLHLPSFTNIQNWIVFGVNLKTLHGDIAHTPLFSSTVFILLKKIGIATKEAIWMTLTLIFVQIQNWTEMYNPIPSLKFAHICIRLWMPCVSPGQLWAHSITSGRLNPNWELLQLLPIAVVWHKCFLLLFYTHLFCYVSSIRDCPLASLLSKCTEL